MNDLVKKPAYTSLRDALIKSALAHKALYWRYIYMARETIAPWRTEFELSAREYLRKAKSNLKSAREA